jgi:hypothetical protein
METEHAGLRAIRSSKPGTVSITVGFRRADSGGTIKQRTSFRSNTRLLAGRLGRMERS